jgi:O-succinylbenzoate synthase
MKIEAVTLTAMKMKLRDPFTTSFGTEWDKHFIVIEVRDQDGATGWGESVAMKDPLYNEETVGTNWLMMKEYLIPMLLANKIGHPDEVSSLFRPIRRNNMAKAGLEGAVWDLYAKRQEVPLYRALGGERRQIEVGISIGIQKSVEELLAVIERHVGEGYRRIKVKIKPGWDVDVIAAIRTRFPEVPLMADANSAYTLADADHLARLDQYNLMMMEQPLAHDDIIEHATLQRRLQTPVCLDESIHSLADARKAIELGSCKIINIKIGRVGGLTEAKRIHDYCRQAGVPVWCGGMLEAGIGRAHNVAITALPGFTLPGDTAASSRYWEQDIIAPEVTVENGLISIPGLSGIGYEPVRKQMERFSLHSETFRIG